jgi:hypothetical protein
MDAAELRNRFEAQGIKRVKVGGFDIDGVLRGKYLALDKFWSVLADGFGFCDVIFGWDIADSCYDNAAVTGPSTGACCPSSPTPRASCSTSTEQTARPILPVRATCSSA